VGGCSQGTLLGSFVAATAKRYATRAGLDPAAYCGLG
jgi:hypothetical protein